MLTKNEKDFIDQAQALLEKASQHSRGNLSHVVKSFIERREAFVSLTDNEKTPFFVLDFYELDRALHAYKKAFARLGGAKHYYALKVNYEPKLVEHVVKSGFGLDASSSREIELALKAGASEIVYSGPGKSVDDLSYALQHRDKITILIDSFSELRKLSSLVSFDKGIRAGVRITFKDHGAWGKFGIPLEALREFWDEASGIPGVDLVGIQFHLSWNENAKPYEAALNKLADYLHEHFSSTELNGIEFIDIGGGFRPHKTEGYFPWNTPKGRALKGISELAGKELHFADRYLITDSITIDEYAKEICACIERRFRKLVPNANYFTEPGRIICNNAMHVLLKVEDKKSDDCVIVDGGINIVGWERFEYDYFPIINLSSPDIDNEFGCTVYGSLCMPQDLWGYYVYGSEIKEGDLLLVPYQGALTYSLRQEFIRPQPRVIYLRSPGKAA